MPPRRLSLLLPLLRRWFTFYRFTAIYGCAVLTLIAVILAVRTWPTAFGMCGC